MLRIKHERGKAFGMGPDFERLVGVRDLEGLDDVSYELRDGRMHRHDLKVAGLQLREVENMVHKPQKRPAAYEDGIDGLASLGLGLEAHLHHLGKPDDRVEGRPYVVAHRREEVAPRLVGALFGLQLLLEKMLLAPAQDGEQVDDDRKRRHEKQKFHEHLAEHVAADPHKDALHDVRIYRLADERAEGGLGGVVHRKPHPHERREEDQDENADPDDDGVSEAREPVDEEHVPVLEESGKAPDGQHEIRLSRERVA